jgi:N-carbamoylputrescine amidase
MRVTVCELFDRADRLEAEFDALAAHVRLERSDLVLLPEMPFHPWFARKREFSPAVWSTVMAAHDRYALRLAELAPAAVLGSRPVEIDGRRLNQGFVWDARRGYRPAHEKYHLPDEPGFWEASWYERGGGDFTPVLADHAKIGFIICSELWFFQHSRAYGQQAVHILVTPRCTEASTREKWLTGGRTAAIVAGAYSLSSNHAGPQDEPYPLGGQGWVIDPDGNVLAVTSRNRPFVTVEIDLTRAEAAKQDYPRYMPD